ATRCAKIGLARRIGGPLLEPSAYFIKSPPEQWHDDIARDRLETFIAGEVEAPAGN
ncbi:MAG: inositol-3-phosphate synthase, partial [Chloroflexi bacterium]|nr:inositol-3-phosphate synthase [Chloroflexota bacterium]